MLSASQGLHFHLSNPDLHFLLSSPGSPVPQNPNRWRNLLKIPCLKTSDGSKPRGIRRRLPAVSLHFPNFLQTFSSLFGSSFVNYPPGPVAIARGPQNPAEQLVSPSCCGSGIHIFLQMISSLDTHPRIPGMSHWQFPRSLERISKLSEILPFFWKCDRSVMSCCCFSESRD